jgi:hypothetical protein
MPVARRPAGPPRWSLERVHALLAKGEVQVGSKVIIRADERLGLGNAGALAHITALVASLTLEDFAETVDLPFDKPVRADVYGKTDNFGHWYIKLFIHGDTVLVVPSCHEPAHTMTLRSGKTLKNP